MVRRKGKKNKGQGEGEILVPNAETLAMYKAGESTMRACGWCKYAGGGYAIGHCMIKGRCSLIPLPLENMNLVPEIKPGMTFEEYEKQESLDSKAAEGMRFYQTILEELIEKVGKACSDAEVNLDVILLWNTECVLAKCLGNQVIRNELMTRMEKWIALFDERVELSKKYLKKMEKDRTKEAE